MPKMMLKTKTQNFQNSCLKISQILFFLTLTALFLTSVSAQDTQNDLEVNVTIATETIIDIQPKEFQWGASGVGINPGTQAGPSDEQNNEYGRLQLENLGSVNITQVWFNTTTPSERPFGTGSSSNYNSGNFITLDRNSTSTDKNSFVSRAEYGLDQPTDQDIIYLNTPSGWDNGRFRNTSNEYFWTVDDTGTDLAGAVFRIGIEHHNETQTGSTNLDTTCSGGDKAGSNTDCNGYDLKQVTDGNGNNWGVTDVEVGVEDTNVLSNDGGTEYCVAMRESDVIGSTNTPKVEFIKWDKGHPAVQAAGGGSGCAYATNYTIGGSSPVQNLVPGDWINMNIRANIPYGVVSGNIPAGQLTVLANSN